MDQAFRKVGFAGRTVIVLILFICFGGCTSSKRVVADESEMLNKKFVPVTVKNSSSLDGCSFLLVKDSLTSFEPVEFPDSLKVDGLKLWIKFNVANQVSICMAGQSIKLTATNYRK
jgi:hypothetical protein